MVLELPNITPYKKVTTYVTRGTQLPRYPFWPFRSLIIPRYSSESLKFTAQSLHSSLSVIRIQDINPVGTKHHRHVLHKIKVVQEEDHSPTIVTSTYCMEAKTNL